MLSAIKITGRIDIGEYPVRVQNQIHQPIDFFATLNQFQIPVYYNSILADSYHIADYAPLSDKVDPLTPLFSNVTDIDSIYLYVLYDGYDYLNTGDSHNAYYGTVDFYAGQNHVVTQPAFVTIGDANFSSIYKYTRIHFYDSKKFYYQYSESISNKSLPVPPNYIDLLSGYYLDNRTLPLPPTVTSPIDRVVEIGYYRENKLEGIPNIRSIDWMMYKCKLVKNVPYQLPIIDCVMGTLKCSDNGLKSLVSAVSTIAGKYAYNSYFDTALADLFTAWNSLYSTALNTPLLPPTHSFTSEIQTYYAYDSENNNRTLRTIGANHNHWDNRPTPTPDLNTDNNHPMFIVNDTRAYNWHIRPQLDGIGDLIMDSPRTIEIHQRTTEVHKALAAGKYAVNELDTNRDRVPNLGYLVEKIASLLGYRVNAHGNIDRTNEQKNFRRLQLNDPTFGKINSDGIYNKYSTNCFGEVGLMIPHLPNSRDRRGNQMKLYDVVHDIPQLLQALHDQVDRSLDIQHGGKTFTKRVPYFAYQKNQPSILSHLTTLKINLAIVLGILLPKKQPAAASKLNPFNYFKPKS